MRYGMIVSAAAARQLKRLRGAVLARVANAIDGLASNPRPAGCLKLADEENLWRVRVGPYRVIYQIDDDALRLLVCASRTGRPHTN
jgi:mRNA interferase RelE/StbE